MRITKSGIIRFGIGLCLLPFILGNTGCEPDTTSKGVKQQESTMERAMAQVQVPQVNNFQTRESIAKWLDRMDVANKEFYIYVLAPMGQYVGYFVAQARPVNICTSITPPVRSYRTSGGSHVGLGPAPGLDGVYYGGSGCEAWYFFDATTDAYIETKGMPHFITDQPLAIEVEQIKVAVVDDE